MASTPKKPKSELLKVWRKPIITDEKVSELKSAFLLGFTDDEACLQCEISPATLYRYCEVNKEFRELKEILKQNIKMRAKVNIVKKVTEGDVDLSKWYLEKTAPEFANKSVNINRNFNLNKELSDDELVLLDWVLNANL